MRTRLLLDSELALFALAAPARLTRETRALIDASEAYVSAASVLEIGLKAASGPRAGGWLAALEPSGFRTLAVSAEHAALAAALEDGPADPLDRLLIAQATLEGMLLLTTDADLAVLPRAAAGAGARARRARSAGARGRAVRAGRRSGAEPTPARCRIVLAAALAAPRRPRS